MKIFITGATGLVGSFVCRELLSKGHQIKVVKRNSSKMDLLEDIQDKIEWVVGDMTSPDFLEEVLSEIDGVIHGAAIISFDKTMEQKMHEVNVLGTADLVNACLKKGIKKFMHISSVAAIGRKQSQNFLQKRIAGKELNLTLSMLNLNISKN